MSYVEQSQGPSPASMAAVIGVHAAIGAALIAGLTVSGTLPEIINDLDASNIPIEPPPPPPPAPADPAQTAPADVAQPPVHAPNPPLDLGPIEPTLTTTTQLPELTIALPRPGAGLDRPLPSPGPNFDPAAARPRNDPSRWLSDRDYRPGWARRELTGLAQFRLEIGADGTVSACTITGSTGHPELDAATCALVARRARFEPARGANGEAVAGSYSSAVRWVLPE